MRKKYIGISRFSTGAPERQHFGTGAALGAAFTRMLPRGGFVVLDTAVTPELEAEGAARDLVRAVQQARKDAGLQVSDRISLTITTDAGWLPTTADLRAGIEVEV